MNKKVLLICNHSLVLYNFHKELIQELLSSGYEVYITLPYDEKVQKMIGWGCKFIETKVDRRGINPLKDFLLLLSYFKIVRQIKPAAIMTFTIKPNIYGGICARMKKIPCINNITGLGGAFFKPSLLRKFVVLLYKISLKKSYLISFENTQNMEVLTSFGVVYGKSVVLPGAGVNLEDYPFVPMAKQDKLIFIFVGRIMKDKGIDNYLEAAKIIRKKYANVFFHVIGFIEETESSYKELIATFQNEGIIEYFGFQENVSPFMKNAHCLVQPSYHEGLSNVLLEAGATGRPLICSDIFGCKETVDVGKNGYLFSPGDTLNLVSCLEKFIQLSDEEKKQMGAHSRAKIESEFNRKDVVAVYKNAINEIVFGLR